MLARTGEALFWTGRYLERAENTARLLDDTYHRLVESRSPADARAWGGVLDSVGLREAFEARDDAVDPGQASVTAYLVTDRTNPSSVLSAVGSVRENARGVRQQLSTELWEEINDFHLSLSRRRVSDELSRQPHELYAFIRRRSQAITGVASETWVHEDGWRFLTLGRHLERAAFIARIIRVHLCSDEVGQSGELEALLRLTSSMAAHRRTRAGIPTLRSAISLLMLSDTLPRSLRFCAREAQALLLELAADARSAPLAARLLGRLQAELDYADIDEVLGGDPAAELSGYERILADAGTAVAGEFFQARFDLDQIHTVRLTPGPVASPAPGLTSEFA
ncbi:MAG: alpha-E domain-containing protein [Microthrixaceae bacterium]